MKRTKRIIGISLSATLVLGTFNTAFAASPNMMSVSTSMSSITNTGITTTAPAITSSAAITNSGITNASVSFNFTKPLPSKVIAYIKPNYKIRLNDSFVLFKDSSNQVVYPLVYRGSTYLPVRAIAVLMGEDIEWNNYSKTVFIGKTLNNPSKSKAKKDANSQKVVQTIEGPDPINSPIVPYMTTAYVKPDINIEYDFELKSFMENTGQTVYPISYNGSIYLPIHCLSGLMNQPISFDTTTKIIQIGNISKESNENIRNMSSATRILEEKYESAIELYDQATDKIKTIKLSKDPETLNLIAASVSEDVALSQRQTINIQNMNTVGFTEDELKAKDALSSFAESSEYYILVLENISYLAASQSDYSMLAETFMDFALQSREKMDEARKAIKALELEES